MMARALFVGWLGVVTLAAQAPPPRIVLGDRLVELKRLELGPKLAIGEHATPLRRGDGWFARDDALVDVDRQRVLWWSAAGVVARAWTDLAGPTEWRAEVADVGEVLVTATGYIAATPTELVGLTPGDGVVRWRRPAPVGHRLVDRDLLLVWNDERLAVFAAANGARGFELPLPWVPRRVVAADFGIAVTGAGALRVLDRSGPMLFERPLTVEAIAAGTDGWFVLVADAMLALDREGKERWRVGRPVAAADAFSAVALTVTPLGDPVLACYSPIADSGVEVVCLQAGDGRRGWLRREPGLGVGHSKYRHAAAVFVVGAELVVTSQASAGHFVAVLDPLTGTLRGRLERRS